MMKLNPLCIMLLLALLCAFFSYNANAQSAGVITSISGTSLTNVANKIIPIAIQKVKEVAIEDVSEGHFSVSEIKITHLDIEGFSVGTNGNSIVVNLDRLAVNVHIGRWRYKTKLFSTSGHASCRGALGAYLEPRLVSLGNRFGLQMGTVNANVQDFHISIGGGVVAKILNGLKSLFNSKIRAAVRNAVEPALKNAILTMAQNISDQIPTSASFAGDSTFSLVPAAFGVRYDNNAVSVAFNGAINGVEVQRHGIENLFAPSGALFDVMLDTFVFNSALASRTWRTLVYDINRPGNLPVPGWYGRDYAYVLPALAAKYPNEAISYQLSFATVPVITSTGGYVGAQVVGWYKLFAGTTNVAVIQANLSAAVSAGIEGRADGKYYITAQIAKPALSFQTNSSEIGNIDFGLMNAILDIASQLLTAVANEVLVAGFQIPSVTGMSLSNPRFTAPEGSIRFGTDIDFNIPV